MINIKLIRTSSLISLSNALKMSSSESSGNKRTIEDEDSSFKEVKKPKIIIAGIFQTPCKNSECNAMSYGDYCYTCVRTRVFICEKEGCTEVRHPQSSYCSICAGKCAEQGCDRKRMRFVVGKIGRYRIGTSYLCKECLFHRESICSISQCGKKSSENSRYCETCITKCDQCHEEMKNKKRRYCRKCDPSQIYRCLGKSKYVPYESEGESEGESKDN